MMPSSTFIVRFCGLLRFSSHSGLLYEYAIEVAKSCGYNLSAPQDLKILFLFGHLLCLVRLLKSIWGREHMA